MLLRFGAHVLDDELFEVRRDGEALALEPKVFDVLRYLVENRERVVAKDELLDALWPGESVSESVLPRCIAVARRVLGDDRTRQAVIATIHGRGYRFVAEVEPEVGPEAEAEEEAGATTEPRRAPASPAAIGAGVGTEDPFVGREEALDRLTSALSGAASEAGRVSLLCGDPGIGKTRILRELARRADERGARWFEGACYEGEGAPAYWPFAQVLRGLTAELDDGARAELQAGAGELAAWVPALGGGEPTGIEGAGAQGRFRLFDAVAEALRRAAAERTVVVAIDDLHWADHDSVLMFEFLARALRTSRVLLIGTYRDIEVRRGHPLSATLSGLVREPGSELLKLRGLDPEQVGALGTALVGGALADEVARAVAELTDGNPFFVREIVKLLEDEGRLGAGPGPVSIALPQSVRDAVGRRLDALSPECNEILRAASVLGRSFETPLLEAVCEPRGEELLEILAEPLAAGIIEEERDGPGRYRFDHAITRQLLYDELSVPRRVSLHRSVGEGLARIYHEGASEAPLAEIAHHYFEAVPGGDVDRAVEWCERAAEHAQGLYAYEESARHYERALEAQQFSEAGDDGRRCELLIRAGEQLHLGGQREAGRERHRQAAALAKRLGRSDLFARAAIGHRGFGEMGMPPDELTRSMLEEARSNLGSDHPEIRARLYAQLVGMPPYSESMAVRDELSRAALEAAEEAGHPFALVSALSARYWATLGPDRVQERLDTGRRALELAEEIGDLRLGILGHEMQIGAYLVLGDREGAHRALEAYSAHAEAVRMPVFRYLARLIRASLACNDGAFAEAERLADEALAAGHLAVPYAETAVAGLHFWIANVRGGSLPDLPFLENLPSYLGGLQVLVRVAGVRALLANDRSDEALRVWEEVKAEVVDLERDENWLMTIGMMASLAYDLDDRDCGETLYALLSPYRELMIAHDLLRGVGSSVASVLGTLEALVGRFDAAVASLEAGMVRERGFGAVPAEVSNQARLGFVLAARDAAGDAERVAELSAESARRAAELGLELPHSPGLKPRNP